MVQRRLHDLLARIDGTATEVEALPLDWDELERLRCASRRLRRAIEIRTIATSVSCRGCERMFVPAAAGVWYCSELCQDQAA